MGADEDGTLAQLKDHHRNLWNAAIERHRGHIANTAGDSILAEFSSVLAKDHTLIRYDARGNGLSDWDVQELSLDAW